jgi:hypothetical protein
VRPLRAGWIWRRTLRDNFFIGIFLLVISSIDAITEAPSLGSHSREAKISRLMFMDQHQLVSFPS